MKKQNLFLTILACLLIGGFIYAKSTGKMSYLFESEKSMVSDTLQQPNSGVQEKPKMQVVFLLDATGSMSGLINTAKEKI